MADAWLSSAPTRPLPASMRWRAGRVVRDLKLPPICLNRALALDRNGRLLAIVHDRAISVYDLADGERIALLQGHQAEGIEAMFQPGGDLLASGLGLTTRLWDPIRGRLLLTLQGNFHDWAEQRSGPGDRQGSRAGPSQIESAGERRTIDCRMLDDRARATAFRAWRIAFSPDGQLIAMAHAAGCAHRPRVRRRGTRPPADRPLRRGPVPARGSPVDLQRPWTLPVAARRTRWWSLADRPRGTTRADRPGRRLSYSIAWPPARAGACSARPVPRQGRTVLLDPDQPWRQTWLAPHQYLIDLAMSPDGRWAATTDIGAQRRQPPAQGLGDSDRPVARTGPGLGYARVAFSPDGRWLGVGDATRYRFLRAGSWTPGATIDRAWTRKRGAGLSSQQPDRRDPGIETVDGAACRGRDRPRAGFPRCRRPVRARAVWSSAPMAASSPRRRPTIRVDVWDLTRSAAGSKR